MAKCLVSLGSNLGDRAATLDAALESLATAPDVSVVARSSWQLTLPVGGPAKQAEFLNGAAVLESSRDAHQLLALLQQIEMRFGRSRHERWGDRTLDLDLLLFGDAVINSPALTVPHPRMSYRRFVLEPAAEIAGEVQHPTIGWTLGELLDQLDSGADIVAIVAEDVDARCKVAAMVANRFGMSECEPSSNDPQAIRLAIPGATASRESPKLSILFEMPAASAQGRGPTLLVPAADGQSVETDVFAAIEAVWPRLGPSGD